MPEDWDSIEEVPDEIKDIWVPNSKIIPVKCFGTVSNEMRVCNSIGILTVYLLSQVGWHILPLLI